MSQFDGFTTVEVDASGSGPSIPWRDEPGDGRRKIGRYPILRRLGAGGMGVVYAAYDEVLGRRLAIKVLHPRVWDVDGRQRERLLREAKAMACINHPNVITVHEVGTASDQLFVVMEFVAGPTLESWLAAQKRTWQQVVTVFRQIAEGVAAIHAAGLVHRDIKPSNVLIGDDGRVRVLDLGLVSAGIDEAIGTQDIALCSSPSLTMTGERVGTPAYMSREQFLGLEPTPASDIFSLSIALYEALYGVHPFMAASFFELQANVEDGHIRPPPSSNGVPAWLHALVVRGLAPEPRDRPASMRALSSELATDPSRARRRWIASLASVALAALVGTLATVASVPEAGPLCEGGEAAIAGVWTRERAADVRAAMIATGQPYAPALAERVTEALDDYADDWAAAHNRICAEHARGRALRRAARRSDGLSRPPSPGVRTDDRDPRRRRSRRRGDRPRRRPRCQAAPHCRLCRADPDDRSRGIAGEPRRRAARR
jgi:tRNA A-37 threonylcarbamoyl transferase component Bud32